MGTLLSLLRMALGALFESLLPLLMEQRDTTQTIEGKLERWTPEDSGDLVRRGRLSGLVLDDELHERPNINRARVKDS